MKTLTKEQVNKKYRGKYVEFIETYDYTTGKTMYEILNVYKTIHENTSLGEDVGTDLEYCR
jgi:hypothetical protein